MIQRPLVSAARSALRMRGLFSAQQTCTLRRHYSAGKRPDFGFAFDIDGVLLRHRHPIPGAVEALKYLKSNGIPFILLTNGGGKHERERVGELSSLLGVTIDEEMFVQSHTPFKGLVERYGDGNVIVVGGEETAEGDGKGKGIADVARRYGFKNVYTPNTVLAKSPDIWPFAVPKLRLQPNEEVVALPGRFDAMLVFNDPRHWGPTLQLMLDLLLSEKGKLGTYSPKNGRDGVWQNDDQPDLIWSNPDLWWQASYNLPRLGQGGFRAALQGVWNAATGGAELKDTLYGKPHKATYEYASKVLDKLLHKSYGGGCLKTVYMVGDNPRSDILGANTHGWHSVLVQTGVFSHERDGGLDRLEVDLHPQTVVEDVKHAVEFAVKNSTNN